MPVTMKFVTEQHYVVRCDACPLESLSDESRERCLERATQGGWRPGSFDRNGRWYCPCCAKQREAEAKVAAQDTAR